MADILIIEDEELVRTTIRNILQFGGHGVSEARDGEEGLAVLGKRNPDLVLCDITMPRRNGYELLKEVRERRPELADLPFLFLSAHAERRDILEGLGLGADDYLTKPIDQHILLAKVDAALRQVARMKNKKTQEHVKLYKALSRNSATRSVRKPAAEQRRRRTGAGPKDKDPGFDRKLQEVQACDSRGAVGKLQFVNLSELKQRLGNRWEKVSRTAMSIADLVVRRHVAQGVTSRDDGTNALFILFPELSEDEAASRVENIANEICIRLLDESDPAYRELTLTALARNLKDVVGDGSPPTRAALAKSFERSVSSSGARSPRAQNLGDRVLSQATVKYLPVWRPASERVVAYQACACLPSGRNVFLAQGGWRESADDPLAAGVRFLMAERVLAHMKATVYKPGRALVCLPIHVATLLGEGRKRIERLFDEVPPSELRDLLMIELIVPPGDLEARAISDAVAFVKRRSRLVAARCGSVHPGASPIVKSGPQVLSWLFTPQAQDRKGEHPYDALKAFARETVALGLEPFVLGLESVESVRAATLAGCRLMAGRAIGRAQDRPRGAYPLPKRQFLAG
jgi:CheY-like chemotaxis protein